MVRFKYIQKIVAMVSAVMLLLYTFSACEQLQLRNAAPEISVRDSAIGPAAAEVFVSVKYAGEWKLYVVFNGADVDWARLSVDSGKGNRSSVILTCDENPGAVSRSLRIVVDTGSKWADCQVTQSCRGSGNADVGLYTIDEDDLKKSGWLELPAMDNPELGYYGHGFYMNNKKYRNYSFGWSQKDMISLWVAYPLCTTYTNKMVDRKDEWSLDPILGELSSAPFGGYGGSYDRGHQLPSADRLCSREANRQTCYGTNITPQSSGHNGGVWGSLENKIRTIANSSDTTYVVTGVVVSSKSLKTTDSYGKTMTVPDGYFKAVLKYSESSTFGEWNAAGFYIDHKYTGSLTQEHSMSIDDLEEKTGLDFFVNLPAKVGESKAAGIEAANPRGSGVWW